MISYYLKVSFVCFYQLSSRYLVTRKYPVSNSRCIYLNTRRRVRDLQWL